MLFALITWIRNLLFDTRIVKSRQHKNIFVLCIGNIRVGGTGKTPMAEYMIKNLKDEFPLAVVSLGYKRKTKGLRQVNVSDSASDTGDEPLQMKRKFSDVLFFVCKNRNTAVEHIHRHYPHVQLIILDDAFQYRKISPDKYVLLTEYRRPFFKDCIMPYGRLRELRQGYKRADYIVVTKCPENISQSEKENFIKHIHPLKHQKVFFSFINYCLTDKEIRNKKILFVSGIDNPSPAVEYLQKTLICDVKLMKFADHHTFSTSDINLIKQNLTDNRILLTTEKDAVKLKETDLDFDVLAIENNIDEEFINTIRHELRKNCRS